MVAGIRLAESVRRRPIETERLLTAPRRPLVQVGLNGRSWLTPGGQGYPSDWLPFFALRPQGG